MSDAAAAGIFQLLGRLAPGWLGVTSYRQALVAKWKTVVAFGFPLG